MQEFLKSNSLLNIDNFTLYSRITGFLNQFRQRCESLFDFNYKELNEAKILSNEALYKLFMKCSIHYIIYDYPEPFSDNDIEDFIAIMVSEKIFFSFYTDIVAGELEHPKRAIGI